nr:uncharacterized protein LOC111506660 [Leptinotarsa decemlineata]
MKREVDLSPEEILTLLSLYENNHPRQQPSTENYRYPWNRFEPNLDLDINQDDSQDQDGENWLDNPVYPHATAFEKDLGPKYMYEPSGPQVFENKEKWRGFGGDSRNKRFMVAKKRNVDPTHELRYINGPNKNDFYTLSQLLSNQREPNLPVYHRLIL